MITPNLNIKKKIWTTDSVDQSIQSSIEDSIKSSLDKLSKIKGLETIKVEIEDFIKFENSIKITISPTGIIDSNELTKKFNNIKNKIVEAWKNTTKNEYSYTQSILWELEAFKKDIDEINTINRAGQILKWLGIASNISDKSKIDLANKWLSYWEAWVVN